MHFLAASAALLAVLKPHPAFGAVISRADSVNHAVTMNVVNANLAPDGFTRSTVSVNGQYPGPPILINKGDSLSITVNNRLTDPTMRRSTSLDLDGIFMPTANLFDEGSAFVTQCPIGPNASYTYHIPAIDQAGTFWYHSQLSVQYLDGFRGPLIVYDRNDPQRHLYDVDDASTIIQLGDWWHNTTLSPSGLPAYEATGIIPVSDSSTFNGVARYNGGPAVPWPVITVTRGKRYRLRIINESGRNVVTFNVDNHPVSIIEADGEATQPQTVNSISLLAGQRYSAVLTANQTVGNYWINTPFVGGNAANNPNQNSSLSRAILRYVGAPIQDPTTPLAVGPFAGALVEADLRPLVVDPVPPADVNITLDLEVVTGKAIWNVNNVSYIHPDTPTLLKVLQGATEADDFNVTENTFILPANKTVQITFPQNDDDDAHPIHMHGMNFWLIKSNTTDTINTVNPIKRDVAGAGAAGMMLRFRTDKPGPWFFHCHIFWHFQAGLATVQLADPAAAAAQIHPPQAWTNLCPAYDALPADQQ